MSDEILGILNPKTIGQHLEFLQGLGAAGPQALYNLLKSLREAEMSKIRTTTEFRSLVESTRCVMQQALQIEPETAHREAELHVNTMLGDTLIWPAYTTAFLNSPAVFRPYIVTTGMEHLTDCLAVGKGVVLAQCHWGAFQMLLPALLMRDLHVLQFFGDADAAAWAVDLFRRCRPDMAGHLDVLVVPDPAVGPRVTRALEQGHVVAIPPEISDGQSKPKLRANFLGHRVYAPEGPAFLAASAGVPMIPVRTESQGPFLHCIFGEPLKVSKTRSGIQTAIDQFFSDLESEIRKKPHQWRGWGFMTDMIASEAEEGVHA